MPSDSALILSRWRVATPNPNSSIYPNPNKTLTLALRQRLGPLTGASLRFAPRRARARAPLGPSGGRGGARAGRVLLRVPSPSRRGRAWQCREAEARVSYHQHLTVRERSERKKR